MITLTKDKAVLFSLSFVCLLARLLKHCSTDFHKIWWKGDTRARKKPLDFGGNTCAVMLGIDLGLKTKTKKGKGMVLDIAPLNGAQ